MHGHKDAFIAALAGFVLAGVVMAPLNSRRKVRADRSI